MTTLRDILLALLLGVAASAACAQDSALVRDGFDDGRRAGRADPAAPAWRMLQRAPDAGTLEAAAGEGGGFVLARGLPATPGAWHYSTVAAHVPAVTLGTGNVRGVTLGFRVRLTQLYDDPDGLRLGLFDSRAKALDADHQDDRAGVWAGYWATLGLGQRVGVGLRKEAGGRGGVTQGADVQKLTVAGDTPVALQLSQWYALALRVEAVDAQRVLVRVEVWDAAGQRVALAQAVDERDALRTFDTIVIGDRPTEGKAVAWSVDDVTVTAAGRVESPTATP